MTSKTRRALGVANERGRGASAPPAAARRWTLLTRSYCHLCDELREALLPLIRGTDVRLCEVDVDAHPPLDAIYGERVPVLFAGAIEADREICALRLDRARVMAALADER